MANTTDVALKFLNVMLGQLVKTGSLTLMDADGRAHAHGDGGEPAVVMRISDSTLYSAIFLNPELKVGEAYMDGGLSFDKGSVRDLLHLFHINQGNLRARPARKALTSLVSKFRRFHQSNPIGKARQNVAHHYDISNDLYRLFLDKDLHYSCAYFEHGGQHLEDAQQAKLRHIAAKLRIEPGMRVLDIGCGWGGLALYLAEHTGADVVGVTLSTEQQSLAIERAKERGVKDKVDFRLCDYRHVEERFDRVVSVGMFEHVGVQHYPEFFRKLRRLLTDDGLALLHAIGRKGGPGATGAWIRKYIFPGGYSPALSETLAAIEPTGLWVTDIEILRLHYADTLKEWERRFQKNRERAKAMIDERFCRMWEFYLSTSEFAFRHGGHMVFQMQLARNVDAAPIKRDYIQEAEGLLSSRDGVAPVSSIRNCRIT